MLESSLRVLEIFLGGKVLTDSFIGLLESNDNTIYGIERNGNITILIVNNKKILNISYLISQILGLKYDSQGFIKIVNWKQEFEKLQKMIPVSITYLQI